MQKLFLALLMLVLSAGSAAAHGGISKLPDSVQIMQYKMLLYMDADNVETKNKLAMAYFRTGKLADATRHIEEVLEKDANNFDALDGMGIIQIRRQKGADALKYLERALAVNDKDMLLHVHLALAYKQLSQPDLAQKSMDAAKKQASTSEDAAEIQKEIKLITES